ncbi:hypothetical protein J1614_002867 [Plenodomus biglobosus]|nr:hypothetical protein J1614_002867 [Plenodomus biglobosus]
MRQSPIVPFGRNRESAGYGQMLDAKIPDAQHCVLGIHTSACIPASCRIPRTQVGCVPEVEPYPRASTPKQPKAIPHSLQQVKRPLRPRFSIQSNHPQREPVAAPPSAPSPPQPCLL